MIIDKSELSTYTFTVLSESPGVHLGSYLLTDMNHVNRNKLKQRFITLFLFMICKFHTSLSFRIHVELIGIQCFIVFQLYSDRNTDCIFRYVQFDTYTASLIWYKTVPSLFASPAFSMQIQREKGEIWHSTTDTHKIKTQYKDTKLSWSQEFESANLILRQH